MSSVWSLLTFNIIYTHTISVTFEQSHNEIDQYCLYQLDESSDQCEDIQTILDGCGDATFMLQLTKQFASDLTDINQCTFRIHDGQLINKSYVLSSKITPTTITFQPLNDTELLIIDLTQTFLSISSYPGTIHINNILFTASSTDNASLIDVTDANADFEVNIHQCEFYNIHNIINIPNIDSSHSITITFQDSDIHDNIVQDKALFFINRNNVWITLDSTTLYSITLYSIIHWKCQQTADIPCGSLTITNYCEWHDINGAIFTIDLSDNPQYTRFNITVYSSHFKNVIGPIFNFNNLKQISKHEEYIISDINTMIRIDNCSFYDNGDSDNIDGAIFSINAATVADIAVYRSVFSNNEASNGAIFDWYCSRLHNETSSYLCGYIELYDSIFIQNSIRFPQHQSEENGFWSGSLINLKIYDIIEVEVSLSIISCNITQNEGALIYIEAITDNENNGSNTSCPPNDDTGIFIESSTFSNNVNCLNDCIKCTKCDEDGKDYDYYLESNNAAATLLSIIGVECIPILIEDSIFIENHGGDQDKQNGVILTADYAPIVSINGSTFVGNRRSTEDSSWPLFYIGNDNVEYFSEIQIIDSVFTDKEGDTRKDVGVIEIASNEVRIWVDLMIKYSFFNGFSADDAALFYLSYANVSIDDTTFNSTTSDGCVLRVQTGDVFITNSIISNNYNELSMSDNDRGFVWVEYGDITATNVIAYNNRIAQNALLFTKNGKITLSYGEYRDNTLFADDVTAIAAAKNIQVTNVTFRNNIGSCLMYDQQIIPQVTQETDTNNDYIYEYGNGSIYYGNYSIYGNDSIYSDVIDIFNEYSFTLSITMSTFIGNDNTLRGGSVIYSNAENALIDISKSEFINNSVVMDTQTCSEYESGILSNQRQQTDTCDQMQGGALYITHGKISINECTMDGNTAVQGAFAYIGESSSVFISSSTNDGNVASPGLTYGGFIFLDVSTSLDMADVNSSNNYAVSGGVIYAARYNDVTLERCRFISNVGESLGVGLGGAIYLWEGNLTCIECFSEGNKGDNGGFIALDDSYGYVADLVSLNDEATKGAVIYITEDEKQFEAMNSTITAPIAYYGAFVYSNGESSVRLNGVTVRDAQANSSVIFAKKNDITIHRSTFINNTALTSVGVIYLGDDTEASITESKFYNNSAEQYAGCIYGTDIAGLLINDTEFQYNKALVGGAIAIYTGLYPDDNYHIINIAIQNTLFDNNIADDTGGSISIKRGGYDEDAELYEHNIILLNNTWSNNKAVQGGALWISFEFELSVISGTGCYTDISQNQMVNVKDNTFTNNYAVDDNSANTSSMIGGAFWFSCLNVNISGTDFDSCHAETNGGVGYLGYSDAWMDRCNFTSHDMVQNNGQLFYIDNLEDDDNFMMTNTNIHGFQKQNDTEIYSLITVTEISSMTFKNIQFYENEVSLFYEQTFLCPLVTFYHCYFESNTAESIIDMDHSTLQREHGEAIVATTLFDGVQFKNNNVGLWMIRLLTSTAQIKHSTIENNINNGIFSTFIHVKDASILDTQFISNTGLYEGILSIDKYGIATIENSIFRYNHVDVMGGAIRSYADVLSIENCTFWNNSADLAGAHIAHYEGQLLVKNSTFGYGYTQGNGGAIWRHKYSAITNMVTNISQSIFKYNCAGFHGGAIFHGTVSRNKDTEFVLNEVEFIENTANISGAAVYIKNLHNITLDITNENVNYYDNTAHQIPGDIMSLPTQVHVTSDVDAFCPNCSVSIAVSTTDIFDVIWHPHYFHEYLWSDDTNVENITSLKDAATLFRRSIDIKQSISPGSGGVNNPRLDVVEQSAYFKIGNGTEILRYYPAIYRDNLTLTVIGLTFDGSEIFDSKSMYFSVTQCLSHQEAYIAPGDNGFTCFWCGVGFYRFIPTHTDSCHDCSAQSGLICNGAEDIYVENDHYPVYGDYSELQVVECDSGTCCLDAECYIWNTSSLCPSNRDGSSQLCAKCESGYSVSPYSRECIECDSWSMIGRFGFMYFLYPVCFYGGLIWWWGHQGTYEGSLSFWEVYVFKTVTFFYQVTPSINVLIPDPSETSNKIDVIEGIFNFQIPIPSICAFEGMTNLHKLLLSLAMPIVCVLWMFIFWLLHKFGCCKKTKDSDCCKKNKAFEKCGAFALQFFVGKTAIKFSISVYAVITRLSFYLLKCQEFEDSTSGLYYAADVECWKGWAILPLMGTIIVGLCPIYLLWKLWADRQSRNNSQIWHLLTLGYKRRAWWYESYRMFCRLFVISFVVISVPELYRLTLIRNIIFGFLIIHIWFLPYSKEYLHDVAFDLNHGETFCLFILCILAMLADYEQQGVLTAYTTLKALPVAVIPFLFVWKFILHRKFQQFVPEIQIIRPPIQAGDTGPIPPSNTEIFFSPRSPMINESQDDLAAQQSHVIQEELHDEDDLYDEKDQEPMSLLAPPQPLQPQQKSKSLTLTLTIPKILKPMNRNRSNDSDYGGKVSKRGSIYKSISQQTDDEDDDDDDILKSTKL